MPLTVSSEMSSASSHKIESQPVHIPQNHIEDLGPISDTSPETWQYHPKIITQYYRQRPLQAIRRTMSILMPFGLLIVGIWLDKIRGKAEQNQKKRAIQLRETLTKLGPTYIKIGQALSTRPDLIPAHYLTELTTLQDQLPSFPNDVAHRFIEEELGAKPEEIYAELSAQPIAAASLGQVYRGKLKTGEKVAVKVQRPDILRQITLDVYIMRTIATWVQRNIQRVRSDLVAITDELASRVFEEMNYVQEGQNAEKFAQLYGQMPEVYVPKIYWDYTGRRVLTMEWIEGTKLTNIHEIQAQGIDAAHLVEVGVNCSLRQLLEHGFFHADPHPGNLLAMPDGKLAYLDFGMMSIIKPYQRYGLIEAVVHLVNRDFASLAEDYVSLEFLTPETDLKPIIPALTKVFGNALGASVAELNFKSITDQMSEMMYEFPFRVPAYYALIIRSMVTLEGIAIGVNPDFKVLSKAYPYIAKRLLTDPAPELRSSLKDLLFQSDGFRWNRLENLLRNARSSPDYNFDNVVEQATDYLFSERGTFIRENLTQELVNTLDNLGRQSWINLSAMVRERIGLPFEKSSHTVEIRPEVSDHLRNIWTILRETPGFEVNRLIPVVAELLTKPETQQMGQKVAEGLAQKAAARLIRHFLLTSEDSTQLNHQQKSLPPAV